MGDQESMAPLKSKVVNDILIYEQETIEIFYCRVLRLKNKEVSSVKVLWRSLSVEKATLEIEADIKTKYPHHFPVYAFLDWGNGSSPVS